MTYHHLNREQRYQIEALVGAKLDINAIAHQLGRHRDTIKRELEYGKDVHGNYCAERAQGLSEQRKLGSRNARKISEPTWQRAAHYLALDLSPQQVSERLWAEDKTLRISHETMYLRIYDGTKGLSARLRHEQRKRRKRATCKHNKRQRIPNRVDIDQRPAQVDAKDEIGHWEGDTIVGKHHQGGVLTLVERKSRYTLARPVVRKTSELISQAMIALFKPHEKLCKTLTLDNGSEFAQHGDVTLDNKIQVFFAKPHSPWERGLNENTNGLLRQYMPKSTSLKHLSVQEVQKFVDRLNHRPRKCLGWRTPHEVFFNLPMTKLTL